MIKVRVVHTKMKKTLKVLKNREDGVSRPQKLGSRRFFRDT